MKLTSLAGKLARFLGFLFLLRPLLVVVITAFSDTNRVVFPPRGFTLRWFERAVHSAEFNSSLLLSIRIAVVSVVAFLQYFVLFGGLFTNYWKLCLTYAVIQMPYVIRTVTANLVGLDTSFEEASLVLGASPVRTLFHVTLPCIRQGIVGGAVFSFVVAFDECVIILFMKSAKTVTFPLRLYSYITESFTPLISAYSTLFIIVAAAVIYLVEKKIGLSKLY